MAPLLLALAALLAAGAPAGHPDSRSTSRVRVQDRRAELELVCQARSVAEALPLDRNEDGALDAAELEAGRAAVGEYLLERYQLFPSREPAPGGELRGTLSALRWVPPAESAVDEARVAASFVFEAADPIGELSIRVRVFRELNPFHRDEARLEFQSDEPARHLFSGESGEVWTYERESARRAGVFGDYGREGLRHIASGYDHLAFLLALVLAARRWQSVLLVVTAFTVAHTLTLALAAFDLVSVRSDLVELAIALSIAYVGALNLLPRPPASRWIEAFGFGLVHGLGFAGAIRDQLGFEPLRITALVGFNVGVECGQLAIVLPLAVLFARLPGPRAAAADARTFLAPAWLRRYGSLAVVALGLYWFLERTGLFR